MQSPEQKEVAPIQLTQHQKEELERIPERKGETVDLRVEELEERVAPRLASNHNETFLVDR